jgi:hypothetical protein
MPLLAPIAEQKLKNLAILVKALQDGALACMFTQKTD